MSIIDYIVIAIYFIGLMLVSWLVSLRIKSSEDMFIAGRNSSWWLSGMSTYMTLFSASTFVIWGGVAYRSGFVAVLIGSILGFASFVAGKYVAVKWRTLKIKSPGEFLVIRFGKSTIDFYTAIGIIGRGVHTAVALYAISVVMSTLMELSPDNPFADPETGHLAISWGIILLGGISLLYTIFGGFLAVLMTDVIQFGVLITVVIFMIPLSIHGIGGLENFITSSPDGYFIPVSNEYPWIWLILWFFLNIVTIAGDWPFVQRFISVPTAKDAKKSLYLVGVLYLITPIIWYFPAMSFHIIDPNQNPEQAYILMSQHVLMKGMLGVMLAAMVSATLSTVSGTLNVFANVFTYDIYCYKRPQTSEKKRMYIGRMFTLVFGLSILAMALIIPYAGGAEKVVVTILTLVIAPLYIPSVWGLFSRRITAKNVIWTMVITYTSGIVLKYLLSGHVNDHLLESTIGFVIPVLLLSYAEISARLRGKEDPGYEKIQQIIDYDADKEPSENMKKAVRSYSHMAITSFMCTIAGIATLLIILLFLDEYDTAVKNIMTSAAIIMYAMAAVYFAYRIRLKATNKL